MISLSHHSFNKEMFMTSNLAQREWVMASSYHRVLVQKVDFLLIGVTG